MKTKRYGWVLMLPLLFFSATVIAQMDADVPIDDQVFLDDVIIEGSLCVGFDCTNGMSFGSDTQILKENNLRIFFDDTSTSASFPSNDWRLIANDSSNGGGNYFAIQDATAGRTVFRVDAGAIANAMYISSAGDVGLGTSTPVVELHAVDGNTPTLRLEQNGSSGFTPQTFDIAANETNFFVRDVTNGSKLPFRIKPGADDNAVYIDSDSDVGMGTSSPAANLHIVRNTTDNISVEIGQGRGQDGAANIDLEAGGGNLDFDSRIIRTFNSGSPGNGDLRIINRGTGVIEINAFTNGGTVRVETQNTARALFQNPDASNVVFETYGDIRVDGTVITSDSRLKSNVKSFDKGLAEVLRLNPITYNYNGKAGTSTTKSRVGLFAQDLQKVVPEFVGSFTYKNLDEDGNVESTEDYLNIQDNEIKYLFINAFKEQQAQLDAKDERIEALENQILELSKRIDQITLDGQSTQVELSNQVSPFIKQNYPNPYQDQTIIEYFLPANTTAAEVQFMDTFGKLLKKVTIQSTGKGQIVLNANDLPSGTYTYSLIVNNQIVETKSMVLTK